ncbi:MAG: tryptophan synthase subunit alpha [Dehalococcoidia bacterium]|nr:tryptophan synthase subunit alpha [Dehalococcoidia bacterium]
MSRIGSLFASPGRKALITYLTAGYPDIGTTLEMVPLLASSGCDIVELGIPFSDPLADGAIIQKAAFHALRNGVTPAECMKLAGRLSRQVDVPLVFMTYFNPVHKYGVDAFCRDCAGAGVSGLIIPDLPPEESEDVEQFSRDCGLDLVYLLAPTSTEKRIDLVASRSRGFIYLVSLTGVTGARETLPDGLESFVARVRARCSQPLCVGFGISTAEQARRVARIADGVIIGSRLVQVLEAPERLTLVRDFISELRHALSDACHSELPDEEVSM